MHVKPGEFVKCLTGEDVPLVLRVTSSHGKVIRGVDKDGKQYTTSNNGKGHKIKFKSIRDISFGVFVLDTQLDKGWRSKRQGARFWEEYCYHAGWSFAYERVHSLADLNYVLGERTIGEDVLLFNGHGCSSGGWTLSNGEQFDALTSLKVNEKNKHKLVIFSACSIGQNENLCRAYLELLSARAIIAYRATVTDDICFIAEPALLQLLRYEHNPRDAADTVCNALDAWKTVNIKHSKKFPLVCY